MCSARPGHPEHLRGGSFDACGGFGDRNHTETRPFGWLFFRWLGAFRSLWESLELTLELRKEKVASAVDDFLSLGGRHLDVATMYENFAEVWKKRWMELVSRCDRAWIDIRTSKSSSPSKPLL